MSELLIQLRDLLVASGAANGADASKKHNDDPAKATGGDEPLSPDNLATCRRLVFMIILSMSPQHGDNRIPSGLFQANCVAILQVTRTMPAVFSHPACVLADSQLCEVPAFGVSQLELQRTPGMTQNSRIREFDSTSVVMFDLWAVERMFSFLGNEAFSNHHDQIRETLMRIFMIHLERQPFSDRCRLLFGFMTDVAIAITKADQDWTGSTTLSITRTRYSRFNQFHSLATELKLRETPFTITVRDETHVSLLVDNALWLVYHFCLKERSFLAEFDAVLWELVLLGAATCFGGTISRITIVLSLSEELTKYVGSVPEALRDEIGVTALRLLESIGNPFAKEGDLGKQRQPLWALFCCVVKPLLQEDSVLAATATIVVNLIHSRLIMTADLTLSIILLDAFRKLLQTKAAVISSTTVQSLVFIAKMEDLRPAVIDCLRSVYGLIDPDNLSNSKKRKSNDIGRREKRRKALTHGVTVENSEEINVELNDGIDLLFHTFSSLPFLDKFEVDDDDEIVVAEVVLSALNITHQRSNLSLLLEKALTLCHHCGFEFRRLLSSHHLTKQDIGTFLKKWTMLMIMVTHIPVTDPRCDQPFQELVIFLASAIWLAGKGLLSNPFQPNQKFPVLVGSREEFSSLVAAVSNFYFDDSPENILQTIDACELHFAENHSHLADLSARCLLHLCGTSQYLRLRAYCLFLSAREELPSQLRIGAWRVAPDILMSFEEDLWHWFLTHASLSGQDDQDLLEIASLQLGWIACSITKSRSSGTVCSLCDLAEEEPPARASSVEAIAVWNRFQFLLSNQLDESIRLNFLSSLVRLALHSPFQSIDSKSSEIFLLALAQLVSSHPRIRLAIGSILPFFLRRPSVPSFKALEVNTTIVFREIRKSLQRKEIAVSDTLLITTGMLGIDADENLFLHVLFILLTLLKEDDFHLRTLVHRQFHVIAGGSPTQVLDFLLPYFDELSQFLASDPRYLEVIRELAAICGVTLKEFLDKLNPLLIPKMLSIGGEAKLKAIEDVAGVVDEDVKVLCINELPVVLSSELMAEVASGTVDSILSYLGAPSAIDAVIRSWAFPIILNLVLKLGEPSKRVKANEALKVVASKCEPDGNGMALQKCISTFYLAILSHMNGIILDSKGVRKHSDRVKCLKSFGQVMKLMSSKDLSSAIPQTLAILQTAMEFSGLRDAALDSWHSFLDTVQGGSLAPIVNQILAALLKSFPLCTPEQTRQMAQLCGFLLFEKASLRDALPLDLPSFPDCPEFADLRSVVAPLLQRQNVIDRLKALTKAISHESTAVVEQSLIQFEKLVLQHQLSTSRYLLDDTSTDFVNDVLESLLRAFRRFNGVNSQIQTLCCRCIGLIGAVDPARIRFSVKLEVDTNLDQFGDKDSARRFSCKLIEKYLVPSLLSTGNSKRLGPLSFAIQEILHFVGFTAEIGDESETYFAMREGRKEDHGRKSQGTAELVKLRNWWMEFPESVRNTIKPLLKSKYFMEKSIAASVEYPIFVKSYGYKEWILSWVKDLAEKCHGSFAKPLFAKCMIVVDTGDTNLACFLLPYLVLNVLMNGNASHSSQIQCELTAVLGDLASTQNVTDLEKDHLGAQTVFTLLDHLTMWARQRRVEASRRTIAKAKRVGKFISAEDPDEELDVSRENVESLLKGVPHALMAKASYRCKAFARALLHCELSIRHERGTDSKAELQDSYSFLQKIYSNLGEPDGMEGIMSLFSDPSLEQQILDHEAAGRWSAAHSCYELALQFAPDQLELHKGLLTCLKNLGLFETMLTHAKGAATKEKDEWQQHLEPFATEAAWRLGHWDLFAQVPKGATGVFEADVGFLLHHLKQGSASVFYQHSSFLYDQIIGQLAAESMDSYSRCYNSVVKLHILSELQSTAQLQTLDDAAHAELLQVLDCRLKLTLPTLKTRDLILSARRALLDSRSERAPRANAEVGKLWLQSSKLMRRAGYHQSAYGAILQAAKVTAPGAIIEKAKWLLDTKQPHRAITELKNFTESTSNVSNEEIRNKASLLLAQTMEETGVGTANVIISILHAVIQSQPDIEKGYFLLGNFHNKLLDNARNNSNNQKLMVQPNTYNLTNEVCKNYAKSLVYGTKHMSQTLPKLLTLWLDLGALTSGSSKQATPEEKAVIVFSAIDKLVSRLADKVPPSLFLMVLPQLISRICHGNPRVYRNLEMILVKLTMAYPQQTLWHLVSVSRSRYRDRASKCSAIFSKVKSDPGARNTPSHGQIESLIQEALKLTDELLAVCNYPIQSKVTTMSVSRDFRGLSGLGSLKMVVPTQKTMTAILPAAKTSSLVNRHPFPANPATIAGFQDEVEIMNSLQKPRKLVVIGSDGRDYIFLLKPKDDLRKDARLMEFNGLINKLLKQDPESRKRNLYIRTYAVVPLNEECGIIEWVENTSCFRHIVVKAYRTKGIHYTHQNVKAWFDQRGTRSIPEVFVTDILPRFPPIFFEWFLDTFPEPTKWFASRRAYSSTLAVMSMVGFVVGLGDRHGENILFDELTGDCVHVDFNCLFEKGLSFDTPEVVPFRLTHNLVDACGLSGVEGVFRRACEVSLSVLRNNRESLGAVLETFIYDPLCEWSRRSSDPSNVKRGETENAEALKHLQAINAKLQGKVKDGLPLSVQGQVDELIAEATDSKKLGVMYIGWTAYY